MDGIADILSNRDFDIPPEVVAVKAYVLRHYQQDVQVSLQPNAIVIRARSAALIGTLRLNAPALKKAIHTEKRLIFRIG